MLPEFIFQQQHSIKQVCDPWLVGKGRNHHPLFGDKSIFSELVFISPLTHKQDELNQAVVTVFMSWHFYLILNKSNKNTSVSPLSPLQLCLLLFLIQTRWGQLLLVQCCLVSSASFSPAFPFLLQQGLHHPAYAASQLHPKAAEVEEGGGREGAGEGGREELWIQRSSVSCRGHWSGQPQVFKPDIFCYWIWGFQRFPLNLQSQGVSEILKFLYCVWNPL